MQPHLKQFLDAYSTIYPTGVSESDKRLRLFGYSLTGKARDWLDALPIAKYLARKKEISSFKQQEGEILYDARERFKLLLKRCPCHKFSKLDIIQAFIMGLKLDTRMLLDASAGGTMKIKTADEVRALIDNMSLYEYRGHTEEEATPRKKVMIDLNTQDVLLASNKLLNIQLESIAKMLEAREVAHLFAKTNSEICEQAHESGACLPASLGFSEEQVKYMGNYSRQQRNPYSNTYNPGWKEHSNFSYRSNNVLQPAQTTPPGTQQQPPRPSLEEVM